MKININKFKIIPESISSDFGICFYGEPDEDISEWISNWKFKSEYSKKFTNIYIPVDFDITQCFESKTKYKYVDGFSPNLNKRGNLHIGHFSNLCIANALQKMGVGEKFIAILGDTLDNGEGKEESIVILDKWINLFNYKIDKIYYASEQECDVSFLEDGIGEYSGTKIFKVVDDSVVGIKSNGSTSYFYQDFALAKKLNSPTLYLTGNEQENHFKMLSKLFPHIEHLPLGLVMCKGKMSTSVGNVIYMDEVMEFLSQDFDDPQLIYNIFTGLILKSSPTSNKKIDMDTIKNPKLSPGLYLSYTLAHIKSAGVYPKLNSKFNDIELTFDYIKSMNNLSPNILLNGLVELCSQINNLYATHYIKDNVKNQKMFQILIDDLAIGMTKLGMFLVDKV